MFFVSKSKSAKVLNIVIFAVFFIIILIIVALSIKSRGKKNLLISKKVKKVTKLDILKEKVKKWKEEGYNVDEIEQKILSPYATRSNDAIRKIKEKTDIRQNFAHRFSGKAGSNGNIDKLFQGLTGY